MSKCFPSLLTNLSTFTGYLKYTDWMKMMWTAENNTNLNEDMIVALVIAVYKQDKLTLFFF